MYGDLSDSSARAALLDVKDDVDLEDVGSKVEMVLRFTSRFEILFRGVVLGGLARVIHSVIWSLWWHDRETRRNICNRGGSCGIIFLDVQ